jgi:hypothetical protein
VTNVKFIGQNGAVENQKVTAKTACGGRSSKRHKR